MNQKKKINDGYQPRKLNEGYQPFPGNGWQPTTAAPMSPPNQGSGVTPPKKGKQFKGFRVVGEQREWCSCEAQQKAANERTSCT